MKVVEITGGNRGEGAAIARCLADDGIAVVLGYGHDTAAAEEIHSHIKQAAVVSILVQADISEEDQAAGLVEQSVTNFGHRGRDLR